MLSQNLLHILSSVYNTFKNISGEHIQPVPYQKHFPQQITGEPRGRNTKSTQLPKMPKARSQAELRGWGSATRSARQIILVGLLGTELSELINQAAAAAISQIL